MGGGQRHSSPNCGFAEKLGPAARPRVEKIHAQVSLAPNTDVGLYLPKKRSTFALLQVWYDILAMLEFLCQTVENEESFPFKYCYFFMIERVLASVVAFSVFSAYDFLQQRFAHPAA
jgi:hypothetical protein